MTIATQYLRLPAFTGTDLPDWGGGAGAFLECQGTYQHGVAALQASQVSTFFAGILAIILRRLHAHGLSPTVLHRPQAPSGDHVFCRAHVCRNADDCL